MAFAPKGEKPEWQMIYEALLEGAEPGDVLTYAELDAVLGRPFKDSRGPLYRAREHLGAERLRWLQPVPNKGYRVIEANEHLKVAGTHKRRAQRQLGAMIRVGKATDISRLSPDEVAQFDSQARVNAFLYSIAVQHHRQLQRHEDALRRAGLL